VGNVDTVFVGEGSVGAFPRGDPAAAGAEEEVRGGDVGGAEAVEDCELLVVDDW
jgi:hypothetical protein